MRFQKEKIFKQILNFKQLSLTVLHVENLIIYFFI